MPGITLRENTEWVETVEDDWNVLVGADKERTVRMVKAFEPSSETHNDRFGVGDASREIVFRIDEV